MTDLQPPVLVVRKHVKASAQHVFSAWTSPHHLMQWWGPAGVECTQAEVDLRIGGGFRLANLLPDGTTVWISGVYEHIDAPRQLVHTWFVESDPNRRSERVTVEFTEVDGGTDITVTHTGAPNADVQAGYEEGWIGCLAGLADLLD